MWPFTRTPAPESTAAEVRSDPPFTRRHEPRYQARSFSAAGNQARYADFKTSIASADAELQPALAKLRAKARALDRNSSSMVRFLQLVETNVIGPAGFVYRCRVKKQDGTLDKSLNERVEMAWWQWCKSVSTSGKLNMVDFLNQMATTYARDGEYLFEIVYDPKYRDNIALNPLEADMIDENLNVAFLANGNQIKMGVEEDPDGRPVAYHLLIIHPGEASWTQKSTRNRWRRVPAEKIVHIYQVRRPGQTRGQPKSTVLNPTKMLDGYREAEVTGRRLAAAQGGFIETEAGGKPGVDALVDGQETEDPDSPLVMDVEPGVIRALKVGQKFKEFNPGGEVSDYAQFEGQIKKDLAMGYGISVMSHGMETAGVSYSGGRTIVEEDRDFYRGFQRFLIDNGMEKIHTAWLKAHALSDAAVFPPSRMQAIMDGHVFRGRGWNFIDPSKDIKANSEGLRTRQMSLSMIAAQRGIDIEDLVNEIAADEEMLKDYGLTLTTDPPKAKNASGQPAKV